MSWVEETGTIVSAVIDLDEETVTTLISFSYGASPPDDLWT